MSTVKLFVKRVDYMKVMKYIQESGVKYYPVRRYVHFPNGGTSGYGGYKLELQKDHMIVPFLILKFDLITLSNELVQL